MRKVYIVAGTIRDYDGISYTIVNSDAVYSSLEKAKKEIERIRDTSVEEAADLEYELEMILKDEGTRLEVHYTETGTTETWQIFDRKIN